MNTATIRKTSRVRKREPWDERHAVLAAMGVPRQHLRELADAHTARGKALLDAEERAYAPHDTYEKILRARGEQPVFFETFLRWLVDAEAEGVAIDEFLRRLTELPHSSAVTT